MFSKVQINYYKSKKMDRPTFSKSRPSVVPVVAAVTVIVAVIVIVPDLDHHVIADVTSKYPPFLECLCSLRI